VFCQKADINLAVENILHMACLPPKQRVYVRQADWLAPTSLRAIMAMPKNFSQESSTYGKHWLFGPIDRCHDLPDAQGKIMMD
jgi:hypothetical protein